MASTCGACAIAVANHACFVAFAMGVTLTAAQWSGISYSQPMTNRRVPCLPRSSV